jgi:hypothetical protein
MLKNEESATIIEISVLFTPIIIAVAAPIDLPHIANEVIL